VSEKKAIEFVDLDIEIKLPDPLTMANWGQYWAARETFKDDHKTEIDRATAGALVGEQLAGALAVLESAVCTLDEISYTITSKSNPDDIPLSISFAIGGMVRQYIEGRMRVPFDKFVKPLPPPNNGKK